MRNYGGVWPALLTPMTSDAQPNLPVLEQLVEALVADGLDGLYITGSTGQWPLLRFAERCSIAETVVRTVGGRIPVMVHVGSAATDEAIALARHAQEIGADAVSAVAPIYYSHSADTIFGFYNAVGAATDLPLYTYHLSIVNKLSVGAEEYAKRLLSVPNIAGMKFTEQDLFTLGLIHTYAGDRLQLFSGADEVMCHAALCGTVGAIGTFYNVWGPQCRKVRAEFQAGAVAQGMKFMLAFQKAIAMSLHSGGVWAFLRSAVRLKYGFDIGLPRPPLGSTDRGWKDEDVAMVLELVDQAV